MAEAPIHVVEYNPQWPELFALEQALLARELAPWLIGPAEHIGSTAVTGLAAKPVIDIMAPVRSLSDSQPALTAAQRIGYVHFPYKPEFMHWFCKPSAEHRTHHLHLIPANSRLWRERLAFRDALRADPALRAEYQALKLRLAEEFRHDRESYTDAKTPFVSRVLKAVLAEDESVVQSVGAVEALIAFVANEAVTQPRRAWYRYGLGSFVLWFGFGPVWSLFRAILARMRA